MTKTNRKEYIDEVLYKFRNGMAREFYYDKEEFPFIPYFYNEKPIVYKPIVCQYHSNIKKKQLQIKLFMIH